MHNQNKAGISLPQDLADRFPASLIAAIAHLQVAREMLDYQATELQHLPQAFRKKVCDHINVLMGDITCINDECCEMLFDIFAKSVEGLPLRKSLLV